MCTFVRAASKILFAAITLFCRKQPSAFATRCNFSDISGLETTYEFSSASKLSVIGFSASVNYVSLPLDASPFLKISGASEQPSVSTENGVVIITPDDSSCTTPESTAGTSSSSRIMPGLFLTSLMAPQKAKGSFVLLLSLAASLNGVHSQTNDACTPALEIEISLPTGTIVSSVFGDTDHYLAATLETVTWGYYDINKPSQISMESGETITVEVITHHSGHDYAKMIRGDMAVEEIFYWATNTSLSEKPEPKLDGTGVHLVTGPIEVIGAEPGDVVEVEILELDPRYNPISGKCYGTNSQKFAGYHYNVLTGFGRDGTPYVRTGGTEAITVFEFVETSEGKMAYGKPVYMYRFPNMTAPDGSNRTFDNNPAVMIPHEFNYGYNGELLELDPILYPEGFDGTTVTDAGGIQYLSPEEAGLAWKVPLRPHIGTLAVMPNNTENYIDEEAEGGANTIPPARFGGNIDDWRIGKGGTMFYRVEVPGAQIVVGDTHAAQGDSELAGTAMETSMTAKLRVTLHKAGSLPNKVATLDFPLLETLDKFVVHGFAYDNYLDQLADPSDIFSEGTSLDLAMADCYIKTRNCMMDVYSLTEEETIALMTTSVDFGITQVVDGNWGVHADIDKWVFDQTDAPYDYPCTTSKSARRRRILKIDERRLILDYHNVMLSPSEYADELFRRVTGIEASSEKVDTFARNRLAELLMESKLQFAKARMSKGMV
jgi:acetamidase/formamidase